MTDKSQTTKWQTCPIGSCSRHQDCMYTPCRAVQAPSKTTTDFVAEIEKIRTDIFYWMTRNHNRGEQSYAMLGEVKERLSQALIAHEFFSRPMKEETHAD